MWVSMCYCIIIFRFNHGILKNVMFLLFFYQVINEFAERIRFRNQRFLLFVEIKPLKHPVSFTDTPLMVILEGISA